MRKMRQLWPENNNGWMLGLKNWTGLSSIWEQQMTGNHITLQSASDVEDFFMPKNLSPSELQLLTLWMMVIDAGNLQQAKTLFEMRKTEYSEALKWEILWHLVNRCKIEFLRFCVEDCCFPANLANSDGSSILHLAAGLGWLEGVYYLVEECHLDPKAQDSSERTPLDCAIYEGDLPTVRYLIETCHCNPAGNDGSDALITASYAHLADMDIMEYLVEICHLDVNARTESGYTALFYAANSGQEHKVQYLCEHGANVNIKNNKGVSMLRVLYERYDELDANIGDGVTHEILYYLRSQGALDAP